MIDPTIVSSLTDWQPNVGDPTLAAWCIVAAYGFALLACLRALHRTRCGAILAASYGGLDRRAGCRARSYHASHLFWLMLALVLGVLGLNKQLDLQVLVTDVGRRLAEVQGWYDQRRDFQLTFLIAVTVLAVVGLVLLVGVTRRTLPRHVLPLVGAVTLIAFVFVRASSFHDVSAVLDSGLLGVRLNWIVEFAGIAVVTIGALRYARWNRRCEARPTLVSTRH